MSVTIHLRPETERRLVERAARVGLSLEEFLYRVAEREAADGDGKTAQPPPVSFEEMTEGLAQAVAATELTEEDVGDFFDDVVKEVRSEKRKTRESK